MEKKASFEDHAVSNEDTSSGTVSPYNETKRGLAPRHVQLMAIGGSIGTGLFVGIGSYLNQAGPLSLVLGYLVWGVLFILPVNLSVGEMCAYLPIRGSIFELAARFVDPAFGFAMYASRSPLFSNRGSTNMKSSNITNVLNLGDGSTSTAA